MQHTFFSRNTILGALLLFLCPFLISNSFAQRDPNLISSRHYIGIEAGVNYTWLGGSQNFYFPYSYPYIDPLAGPQTRGLNLTDPGHGFGFLFGATLDISLTDFFALQGRLDYRSHSTSITENSTTNCPDIAGNPRVAHLTSTFATTTSYISFDALLRLQFIPQSLYGLVGFGYNSLLNDQVSGHQTISPSDTCEYLSEPSNTFISSHPKEVDIPAQKSNSYFSPSQFALKLGLGTFFELGTSHWVLTPELQLAVPLSEFISSQFRSDYARATPTATAPKMWYIQFSLGLKFPFGAMSKADMESTSYPSSTSPSEQGYANLKGKVTDAKSGKPVQANVTVTDLNNNQVVTSTKTDDDGEYDVRVKAPGRYSVTADADGYLFGSAYYQVDDEGRILRGNHDIKLDQASGRTRLLVFFDFDKAELQRSSYPELDRVVHLMNANPNMEVEIAGYTDSKGTDAYNHDLSHRRADAVKEYLLKQGISPSRITTKGYGKDNPIAPNDTDEGRAENRRVEFVVLHK